MLVLKIEDICELPGFGGVNGRFRWEAMSIADLDDEHGRRDGADKTREEGTQPTHTSSHPIFQN